MNETKRPGCDKFDEYKFFAGSTQHLSERRQAATQVYLGVNTAIFAVFAFLVKDTSIGGTGLILMSAPLFVVGLSVCGIWYKIIAQYKKLINWRYEQLMEMERDIDGSHQMYVKELEEFFKLTDGKEKFGFSRLEVWLPRLFFALYISFAVVMVVGIKLRWFVV